MKPYTEKRPWGKFEQFTENEQSTVKVITIRRGGELSLQYHKKRREFWKILRGRPRVTIGNKTVIAKVGDEFIIPRRVKHRISAPTSKVEVLEVAFGFFDEMDIVRLKDQYGRR